MNNLRIFCLSVLRNPNAHVTRGVLVARSPAALCLGYTLHVFGREVADESRRFGNKTEAVSERVLRSLLLKAPPGLQLYFLPTECIYIFVWFSRATVVFLHATLPH